MLSWTFSECFCSTTEEPVKNAIKDKLINLLVQAYLLFLFFIIAWIYYVHKDRKRESEQIDIVFVLIIMWDSVYDFVLHTMTFW